MVAVLGVLTSSLTALALYRVIALSSALRLEHARDSTAEELARLTATPPATDTPPPNIIGMRGGLATDAAAIAASVPPTWGPPLVDLTTQAQRIGKRIDVDVAIPGARLIASAQPTAGGRTAWVASAVRPSPYLRSWRVLVAALTVSALLLVIAALTSLVTLKRGAGMLLDATRALAIDLKAPVPRPPVSELAAIGDGIATLARHLAEARQAQERLGRDLARQERLAALGRVVAGVAHEVRNPLASIKLRLDLAASPSSASSSAPPLPPQAAAAIAHASAEIARLDGLVADLLTLSGRALGQRAPMDLSDLARRRAEALAPWAALRRVTIRVAADGTATPPIVRADADRLARAIDNLLRNAVEASPDGGVVDVEVDAADTHPSDGQIHLRVLDRGAGFPAGRAGELFEPFFTTKPDGTGLGLAISRAIAQAHDGALTYGRDGAVTRFDLTLPRETGAGDSTAAGVVRKVDKASA